MSYRDNEFVAIRPCPVRQASTSDVLVVCGIIIGVALCFLLVMPWIFIYWNWVLDRFKK